MEQAKLTIRVPLEKKQEVGLRKISSKKIIKSYPKADLIIANNVLAHIPNLKDFIHASLLLLKEDGIISVEVPHLLNLIKKKQFDTIYDEHYFYFSLTSLKNIFNYYGLEIFDVEELKTHGGSLRVFFKRKSSSKNKITKKINIILNKERKNKLNLFSSYSNFRKKIDLIKKDSKNFLLKQKNKGKKIVAFGAAHKSSTFLNYCKINESLISHVIDDTKIKIGKFCRTCKNINYLKVLGSSPSYLVTALSTLSKVSSSGSFFEVNCDHTFCLLI